jgi:hypothetical protein
VAAERELLRAEAGQALLHGHAAGQQAPEAVDVWRARGIGVLRGQLVEQRHHAAALGPDRLACRGMRRQRVAHGRAGGQRLGMQLGVAAGQPDRVAGRQRHRPRAARRMKAARPAP